MAGKHKKLIRGDYTKTILSDMGDTEEYNLDSYHKDLKAELGDVLWYISEMCNTGGWTLEELMADNIAKLTARKEASTLRGSGDNR